MTTLNFCALAALVCVGCAGADGADGTDGARGKAGETPEITTREASDEDCPGGGSEVTIGEEVIVICDGEAGEDGADGMDGEDGAPGADGVDATAGESIGVIEASLYCQGELGATGLFATYSAVVFTDGSLWLSAGVDDGVLRSGNTAFFHPAQAGNQSGEVAFVFDVQAPNPGGTWFVRLDAATFDVVVEYLDADVAGGELAWSKNATDPGCVLNEY